MGGIPKTVQWLLDFVNLSCKPGKLNPPIEAIPELKRQPKPPPDANRRVGLLLSDYTESISYTDGGYQWLLAQNKEPLFVGGDDYASYPSLEEYRQFFLEKGLPPNATKRVLKFRPSTGSSFYACTSWELSLDGQCDVSFITEDGKELILKKENPAYCVPRCNSEIYLTGFLRKVAFNALSIINNDDAGKRNSFFNKMGKNYNILNRDFKQIVISKGYEFQHDNTLPMAIYAYILDFWVNHQELHSYLKQCPYCGTFWIEGKTKRKPKKFCSEKCKIRFNQQSREDNKETVKITRETIRKHQIEKDYKKIVEIYSHNKYDKEYAEQKATYWVYKKRKTYKQFLRKEKSWNGEGLEIPYLKRNPKGAM